MCEIAWVRIGSGPSKRKARMSNSQHNLSCSRMPLQCAILLKETACGSGAGAPSMSEFLVQK
jgi:hypothetical protein